MTDYNKTVWEDRIIGDDGEVLQEGTPVDAQHLNHIEEGIDEATKSADGKTKVLIGGEKKDEVDISLLIITLDGGGVNGVSVETSKRRAK